MKNLKDLKIDVEKTIGQRVFALEARPCFEYKEGIKGMQEGTTFQCLSEKMN